MKTFPQQPEQEPGMLGLKICKMTNKKSSEFRKAKCEHFNLLLTGPDSVMVRASASEAGGRGFESGPRHTKDVKNGTSGYLAWRPAFIRLALASLLSKR